MLAQLSGSTLHGIQYPVGGLLRILQHLRLPDPHDSPASRSELLIDFLVAPHIAFNFVDPPFCPGGKQIREARKPASFVLVSMPHIAINEHGQAAGTNYQIGMPRSRRAHEADTAGRGRAAPGAAQAQP